MSESNANLVLNAPLVVVTDDEGRQHYVYQGTPVPSWVQGAQRTRLLGDGLLREQTDEEKAAADSDEAKKPARKSSK